MGIIEDSMIIITFIYKNRGTSQIRILEESDFDKSRVKRAMEFLEEEDMIKYSFKSALGYRMGVKCTSKAVKLIESPKESEGRKDSMINLNINIDSVFKADFESLLKVDSIFKGSLFSI